MKKLRETFNLDDTEDDEDLTKSLITDEEINEITTECFNNLEKIDNALPGIKGLEASDKEMDDIAEKAINSYQDLMDLGMNVEARVASDILSVASQFLGHAITSKDAKVTKKLKMIELQLRKAKLDLEREKFAQRSLTDSNSPVEGEGKMIDRNELVKSILEQVNKSK